MRHTLSRNVRTSRRRPHGFTLIELLLVLVILIILTSVVVVRFRGRTQQAQDTAAKTDIAAIGLAIDAFEVDNGRAPTTEEGLAALIQAPAGVTNWRGPYLKKDSIPLDPWGNQYQYRYPGNNNPTDYDLSSLGPDGREGNDDITNWTRQ